MANRTQKQVSKKNPRKNKKWIESISSHSEWPQNIFVLPNKHVYDIEHIDKDKTGRQLDLTFKSPTFDFFISRTRLSSLNRALVDKLWLVIQLVVNDKAIFWFYTDYVAVLRLHCGKSDVFITWNNDAIYCKFHYSYLLD